jgi:uncharacterized membrane protein
MMGYQRQLEADLARWETAGWVSPAARVAIAADVAKRAPGGLGVAPVLAMLGAIMLCFGVMLFVGSHWQDMPRIARLGLLIGGLWTSFGIAGLLAARGHPAFAEAAIVFAIGLYGAAIMLIGQMYNLSANASDGLLVWLIGAVAAAFLLRSNAGYAVSVLLAGAWTLLETLDLNQAHWPFIPVWLALFALIWVTTRSRPVLHLLGIVGTAWVVMLGYVLDILHSHELITLIGAAILVAAATGGDAIDNALGARPGGLSRPMACHGLVIAFAGLFAMQFISRYGSTEEAWRAANGMPLAFVAAFALALVLGSLWLGVLRAFPALTWLAYIGFSIEIVALYFRTVGTLLDTSLFFLSAGVLVCLLAFLAWRLHQRQSPDPDTKGSNSSILGVA